MISKRLLQVANWVTDQLANSQNLDGCLCQLAMASEQLDRHGFVGRSSWADIRRGAHRHHMEVRPDSDSGALPEWCNHERSSAPVGTTPQRSQHSELLEGGRCRLVVIGVEIGGRFNHEVVEFVDASASVETFSTLGLATPVDADVAHLMWPCVRCFVGRGPERRVVWHPRLRARSDRSVLGDVRRPGPVLHWCVEERLISAAREKRAQCRAVSSMQGRKLNAGP